MGGTKPHFSQLSKYIFSFCFKQYTSQRGYFYIHTIGDISSHRWRFLLEIINLCSCIALFKTRVLIFPYLGSVIRNLSLRSIRNSGCCCWDSHEQRHCLNFTILLSDFSLSSHRVISELTDGLRPSVKPWHNVQKFQLICTRAWETEVFTGSPQRIL